MKLGNVVDASEVKFRCKYKMELGAVVSKGDIPARCKGKQGFKAVSFKTVLFRGVRTAGYVLAVNSKGSPEFNVHKYIGGDRTGLTADQWKIMMFR